MKQKIFFSILICMLIMYSNLSKTFSQGCTTFSLIDGSRYVFGRNLDVDAEFGDIFINKRNMNKIAYFDSTSTEPAVTWVSKYGSITFNQISCDIPQGGMNEQGLIVEHMYLATANYPIADSRPAVISHQWIQYVLDNCQNVSEVIAIQSAVRISDSEYKFPIHFHIMDSSGDRAIIEFLADTFTVYRGIDYTACVLSNSDYAYSLNYLSNYTGWGGSAPIPSNVSSSPDRFVKAADMVKNYPGITTEPIIPYSFSILDSVWNNTKWQLVYDLNNLSINYRIVSDTTIHTLCLSDFDFDCLSGTEVLEIGDDPSIPLNWFSFSTSVNTTLINTACSLSGFLNSILGPEADDIAVHPENTSSCNSTIVDKVYYSGKLLLYPNPTTGKIQVDNEVIKKIVILNSLGMVIFETNKKDIDISNQLAGVYFIRISTDKKTITGKIIKK